MELLYFTCKGPNDELAGHDGLYWDSLDTRKEDVSWKLA